MSSLPCLRCGAPIGAPQRGPLGRCPQGSLWGCGPKRDSWKHCNRHLLTSAACKRPKGTQPLSTGMAWFMGSWAPVLGPLGPFLTKNAQECPIEPKSAQEHPRSPTNAQENPRAQSSQERPRAPKNVCSEHHHVHKMCIRSDYERLKCHFQNRFGNVFSLQVSAFPVP